MGEKTKKASLRKGIKKLTQQARKTLWQEAAKDPLFLKDVAEIDNDFKYADAETISSID
jgi:hypothetical protein